MPPSPALQSEDVPSLLFERGPCAVPVADWGQQEQVRSILHPNTSVPSGAPSQLPGPAMPTGTGEPHLYGGPGNGVEQENSRNQHPSHDSILNLPEAEQECHTEGHKVQPCKREKPGLAEPGCTQVLRNAPGSGQLWGSCRFELWVGALGRGREMRPLHDKGLGHR